MYRYIVPNGTTGWFISQAPAAHESEREREGWRGGERECVLESEREFGGEKLQIRLTS